MSAGNHIQIVDLFAGPGGLGEGFSSQADTFRILVSAEKDPAAYETLRLRAYYRLLARDFPEGLEDYYKFCNGGISLPWTEKTRETWETAGLEARLLTLGCPKSNSILDQVIDSSLDQDKPWVLIGGPPCQAYSVVGRARNRGVSGYRPEEDHRHFLYKEYLRIIQQYRPSVFVMENVKGILSAKVGGRQIFHDILQDLADPDKALGFSSSGEKYLICSLATGDIYRHGDDPKAFDATKFIIQAENFGIPQTRHRVILLGIKESLFKGSDHLNHEERVDVGTIIDRLPALRSSLSRNNDKPGAWGKAVLEHIQGLLDALDDHPGCQSKLTDQLEAALQKINGGRDTGGLRYPRGLSSEEGTTGHKYLDEWYLDNRLKVWLNHEARGHMSDDLRRYVFAAAYTKAYGYSPKGPEDFNLPGLRPSHKNWDSGKFSDRFRVQADNLPATTITSHISKDGHYFIHYDPAQCRSLTVREAARLQTFPDNYFFCGNRTEQFHQVGNAVPPMLAKKIADIVRKIIMRT